MYQRPENLPMSVDIIGYRDFYTKVVQMVAGRIPPKRQMQMMELGVRYGCSSRMLMEAVPEGRNYKLVLIDPVSNGHIQEIIDMMHVFFTQGFAEDVALDVLPNFLDLLHIDVDPHEYIQTKNILALYKDKVCAGGAIICHDCTNATGVLRAVKEFVAENDYLVEYCPPDTLCPQSAPCVIWKG